MDERKEEVPPERPSVLAEIDKRLTRLKPFETDLRNEEVERARMAMKGILEPRSGWFGDRGIVVGYHGSLQYNDPGNLDVDITFTSKGLTQDDRERMDGELVHEFTRPDVWPRNPCLTDFSWINLDRVREEVLERGDSDFDPQEDDQVITGWASFVLSSPLLFESQRGLAVKYQQEIRKMATESKWLREGIVNSLDEAIEVRESRRNGDKVLDSSFLH